MAVMGLMEQSANSTVKLDNNDLTPGAAGWSRQLFYMLTLSVQGEALRRLENIPEGQGAEAWRAMCDHYEPKRPARYLGMLRQLISFDFGDLSCVVDRIEQFRLLIRRYADQSGEDVPDNVLQAAFAGGI